MKYAEVAENVKRLVDEPPSQDEFIYELLLAYNTPKNTVARLKNGQLNQSKEPGEVLLKKKVWFKNVSQASSLPSSVPQAARLPDGAESPQDAGGTDADKQAGRSLYDIIEELKSAKATKSNDPRFLIVTDFEQILAVDRKTGDTLDVEFCALETNVDFFLPWAGMEKTKLSNENPADIKAAEKMAQLYDPDKMPDGLRAAHHNLDQAVDRLYRSKPFASDEERLEHLFKLYEEMTQPSLKAMEGTAAIGRGR